MNQNELLQQFILNQIQILRDQLDALSGAFNLYLTSQIATQAQDLAALDQVAVTTAQLKQKAADISTKPPNQ